MPKYILNAPGTVYPRLNVYQMFPFFMEYESAAVVHLMAMY